MLGRLELLVSGRYENPESPMTASPGPINWGQSATAGLREMAGTHA